MFNQIIENILLGVGIVSSLIGISSWASQKPGNHRLRWMFIIVAIILFALYFFMNSKNEQDKKNIPVPKTDTIKEAEVTDSRHTGDKPDTNKPRKPDQPVQTGISPLPDSNVKHDEMPPKNNKLQTTTPKKWIEFNPVEKKIYENESTVLSGDVNVSVNVYSGYCNINLFYPGENGKKYKGVELRVGEEQDFESNNSDYKFRIRLTKISSDFSNGIFKITTWNKW